VEGDTILVLFVSITNDKTIHEGGSQMKRFLGILVASMFLASAAYAADAMKEEKKADAKASEKKAEGKAKGDAKAASKKTDGKAKSAEVKGGAMGDAKAGEKKAGAMGEEKKSTK
jgi:hypothetical protein